MVPIPYGVTYTTTVSGQIAKVVGCDRCGTRYVYLLEATTSGQGTSFLFLDETGARDRSNSTAQAQLIATLEGDCDVIPCPKCGHIQHHMLERARELRFGWLKTVAKVAYIVAGIACLPALLLSAVADYSQAVFALRVLAMWGVIAAVGLGAHALNIWQSRLRQKYDPNDAPIEVRKRKAEDYAYTEEEFIRELQTPSPP